MHVTTDEGLVLASREGDRTAFAALVKRYHNLVFGVAYNGLGDFGRSEDVAQDTFVIAWERGFDLAEPARIAAWLCGIARNLVRNQRRRDSREAPVNLPEASPVAGQATPEELSIAAEESDFLWSVLEHIPEIYREPMILFYREEATSAEVAASMGVSEDVVRQRLSRGRKMLEVRVAELVDGTFRNGRPSDEFVGSVLLAIPASAAPQAVGGAVASTATKSVWGTLGILTGPLIGVAGALYGSKRSLDNATSETERRFMWKMIAVTSLLVVLLLVAQIMLRHWVPHEAQGVFSGVLWACYAVALLIAVALGNRRIRRIKIKHGTEAERRQIPEPSKAVSTKTAKWNLTLAIFGSTAWMLLVSAGQSDWIGLTLTAILVLSVLAVFLTRFQPELTGAQQMRVNLLATAAMLVGAAAITAFRWQQWRLWDWM